MKREEILLKAREQRRPMDERELFIKARAGEIAATFGMLFCWVVNGINLYYAGEFSVISFIILCSIQFSNSLIQAIRLKKVSMWIISILWLLMLVVFLIIWIRDLKEMRASRYD
ncbi:MAG: hypothetical protein J6K89_01840 [Oscillospiraceae bacterium]|nr:hypothetical protein [Oscillospiraceae bacterium]